VAYYQGDYYQGDYYQGDPFIGGLIATGASWLAKKIFKRQLTTVGKRELARRVTPTARGLIGAGAGIAVGSASQIPIPFTKMQIAPGAFFPGGQPLLSSRTTIGPIAAPALSRPAFMSTGGCCPSGFHLAKDGSGKCVRNRSMNVANPRALRRSLRRVSGFGKLAQRSKKSIRLAAKAIGA